MNSNDKKFIADHIATVHVSDVKKHDTLSASDLLGKLAKPTGPRLIRDIAREIFKLWPNCYFGARPYLMAMMSLERIGDHYGADDAKGIIAYFLSNAQTWRGADARRLKAELKAIAGIK